MMINSGCQALNFGLRHRLEVPADAGIFILMQTIIPAQAEHAVWTSAVLQFTQTVPLKGVMRQLESSYSLMVSVFFLA
jgi:hypothetical protein